MKITEVFEHVFSFMKKLVMHIPEVQFKMIRYYGRYATCNTAHKVKVKEMLMQCLHNKSIDKSTYRKDLIDWVPPARRKDENYDTT